MLSDVLQSLGFVSVQTEANGAAALDLLRQNERMLVIAELRSEPLSGLDLLRTIRSEHKLRATPFIMAAASPSPAEVSSIRRAGADSLVLTPFRRAALALKIESVLARIGHIGGPVTSRQPKELSASLGPRGSRGFGRDLE